MMDVQALWAQLQESFTERLQKLQSQEAALDQRAQELAAKEANLQKREAQQAEQARRLETLQTQVAENAAELAQLRAALLQGLRTAYGERLQLESALAAAGAWPPAPLLQQQQQPARQQQQQQLQLDKGRQEAPMLLPLPAHQPLTAQQSSLPPDAAVSPPAAPPPAPGTAATLLVQSVPGPHQVAVGQQPARAAPIAAEPLEASVQAQGDAVASNVHEPTAHLHPVDVYAAGGYAASGRPLWGSDSLAEWLAGQEPGTAHRQPRPLQPQQQEYQLQQQQQHPRQQLQQPQQQPQGGRKRKHHGGGEGGHAKKSHGKGKAQPAAIGTSGSHQRQQAKHGQQHRAGGSGVGPAVRGRPAKGGLHPRHAAASDSDGEDGLAAAVRMLQAEAGTAQQADQANPAQQDDLTQQAQHAHQPAPLSAAGTGASMLAIGGPVPLSPRAGAGLHAGVRKDESGTTAKQAQQRRVPAERALASDDPQLLDLLKQHSIDVDISLIGEAEGGSPAGEDNNNPGSRLRELQAILDKVMEGAGESGRQPFAPPPAAPAHNTSTDNSPPGQQYCLGALEGLIERAAAYSRLGQPIRWGWCRPLRSFLFVFEPCNCLVLETPRYGHATWFFEMEEPMPVEDQVRRLVAVLSVRGISKGALLEGLGLDDSSPRHAQRAQHAQQATSLEAVPQQQQQKQCEGEPRQSAGREGEPVGTPHAQQAQQQGAGAGTGELVLGGVALGEQEAALLESCGLSRAAGVPSLVNFSGRRIRHSYSRADNKADWRERVSRELASCARAGRIHKEWTAPLH